MTLPLKNVIMENLRVPAKNEKKMRLREKLEIPLWKHYKYEDKFLIPYVIAEDIKSHSEFSLIE